MNTDRKTEYKQVNDISRPLAWPTRTLQVWSTRGVLRTVVTVATQVTQNVLAHKRTLVLKNYSVTRLVTVHR